MHCFAAKTWMNSAVVIIGVCASLLAHAQSADDEFAVWEYRVLGNSLLSDVDIGDAVYSYLGPQGSLDTIESARSALEERYRVAGYPSVLVDIPPQSVEGDGVVRLLVTESTVDRVRVSGARYRSARDIRAEFESLQPGEPIYVPGFSDDLQRVSQRNSGLAVNPVLRPGRAPGTTEVELRVEDSFPGSASVEFNDNSSRDTSDLRATLALGYDNFWGRADSLSLQYQTSPENTSEVSVLAATYVLRPEDGAWTWAAYAVDSASDVATLGDIAVLGNGRIFGVRAIRPLAADSSHSSSLVLGLDHKDFTDDVTIDVDTGLQTEIDYLAASLALSGTRRLASGLFAYGAGVNFGLRGAVNERSEFEDKRFKARPNFFYLTAEGRYRYEFESGIGLEVRAQAQLADQALISNEQFSLGGATSVRGYYQSEQLADMGVAGSLELLSPNWNGGARLNELRVLSFIDWAGAKLIDPLEDQAERFRLYSGGIGLRFSGFGGLDASVYWAKPLRDGASTLEGDDRLLFSLGYAFQ
jgi:hemolysin activation/secretion protein